MNQEHQSVRVSVRPDDDGQMHIVLAQGVAEQLGIDEGTEAEWAVIDSSAAMLRLNEHCYRISKLQLQR